MQQEKIVMMMSTSKSMAKKQQNCRYFAVGEAAVVNIQKNCSIHLEESHKKHINHCLSLTLFGSITLNFQKIKWLFVVVRSIFDRKGHRCLVVPTGRGFRDEKNGIPHVIEHFPIILWHQSLNAICCSFMVSKTTCRWYNLSSKGALKRSHRPSSTSLLAVVAG